MSVTPREILDWAEGYAHQEVEDRAIISRAYYAAYLRCKEWHSTLPRPGRATSNGGTHDRFIYQLLHPDVTCPPVKAKRSQDLGHALQAMKAMRFRADYEHWKTVSTADAQQACAEARLIFAMAI